MGVNAVSSIRSPSSFAVGNLVQGDGVFFGAYDFNQETRTAGMDTVDRMEQRKGKGILG